MASIKQIREQYPQYSDMSDEDLARALHSRFYSDMDFGKFSQQIGLTPEMAPAGTDVVETLSDGSRIVRSKETGQETLLGRGGAYATTDPARIAEARASGAAGEAAKKGFAQDIIAQTGEAAARGASALKGVPFIGSYIDDIIGATAGPQAAQATRAAQEAREIVAPGTVALSRAGTAVATAPAMIAAAPQALVTPLGSSFAGRLAAGTALGTAGGAIEGGIYGSGEGSTREERKASAESGALTGALFGGALGALGPAVGGAIGAMRGSRIAAPAQATARQLGVKEGALDLLSAAAGMDAPVAAENMARAGRYASLGQMGPATQNLLDLAASSTSPGAAIARQNIDEVAEAAGRQFADLMDNTLGGPQAAAQLQDLLMESSAPARKAAYDAAYGLPVNYASAAGRKLEELLGRLDSDILNRAARLMRIEGQPSRQIMAELDEAGNVLGYTRKPDVRQIDYITRALRDVSPTAAPEEKNVMRGLASDIRSALDDLVPEYKQARDIAGDVISLRDAIDFGTDLLNPKTTRYDVSKTVKGMSASELSAVKQGLRAQLDEVMANTKAALSDRNQDAREMVKPLKDMLSRAGRQKLEIILGDQSKEFLRQLDEVYSAASMRASVAQNSKTQVRKMAQDVAMDRIRPTLGQSIAERGGVVPAMAERLQSMMSTAPTRQQAFEELMGEIALPLTRQGDLQTLQRQIGQLQRSAPQLQRAQSVYEAGKRGGTYGAIGLTPAMQSLLGQR